MPFCSYQNLSLPQPLCWPFSGNVLSTSIAIGDVDNDGDNEMVVANINNGDLAIFKGIATSSPWQSYTHLGSITCLAVGDVRGEGKNSLVCINAEGNAFVFDFNNNKSTTIILSVPVNVSRILIADIDNDGKNELVLGRTDRIVHAYKFHFQYINGEEEEEEEEVEEVGNEKKDATRVAAAGPSSPSLNSSKKKESEVNFIKEVNRWCVDGQLGTLAICERKESRQLIAAQPGGEMAALSLDGSIMYWKDEIRPSMQEAMDSEKSVGTSDGEASTQTSFPYQATSQESPLNVATEIVCHSFFGHGKDIGELIALITLDGSIKVYDFQNNGSIRKKVDIQVDHQLFSLHKLCPSPKGPSHVVFAACSWGGETYILDSQNNLITYQFDQRVSAFAAGNFAIEPGMNVPCFFYVNFEDEIHVYPNLKTTVTPISIPDSLFPILKKGYPELESYSSAESLNEEQCESLRKIIERVLYHQE